MTIKNLKKLIDNFNNGVVPEKPYYASILAVEQVLKKKYNEILTKASDCANHMSQILGLPFTINTLNRFLKISFTYGIFKDKIGRISVFKNDDGLHISLDPVDSKLINEEKIINAFVNDEDFNNFYDDFLKFLNIFKPFYRGINTNVGLYVDLNLEDLEDMKILISDMNYKSPYASWCLAYPKTFYDSRPAIKDIDMIYTFSLKYRTDDDVLNFYLVKSLNSGKKEVSFNTEEAKDIFDEELIAKLYISLKLDISMFPKDLQDEIKQCESISKTQLKEQEAKELEYFRKIQVERIKKAYEYFKMATELLNNAKTDLNLEKIELDNINQVIFKNNGIPNEKGYIEFEDFFKNNMILRMLDLSSVDLTNVDIRGIDFSGTNIHINPQTIYQKNMTNVNCYGVKFSPFSDCFDDVILDGAIINDGEASIDLSKVKSYNEQTKILNEVIDVFGSNKVR